MKENVGGGDRVVRSIAGPALLVAAVGPLGARRGRLTGLFALVAGALVTETAVTSVCPVNAAAGIDSTEP